MRCKLKCVTYQSSVLKVVQFDGLKPSLKHTVWSLKSGKKRVQKPSCVVCRQKTCIDDNKTPKVIFKINPDYKGRVTRSITKILDTIHDFIIIEIYRCMPLLGDEQEKVPNWDVHIVHYAIVFTNKHEVRLAQTKS